MKKQIFILIVAIFATSTVFGQMKAGSTAQPLTGCTPDALHPLAGVPYNYEAIVSPTGGNFQWWATKDFNFITTPATPGATPLNNSSTKLTVGTQLLNAGTSYGTTSTTSNVDITWSSSTLAGTTVAAPTFVVVQYDATSPSCANNLKVYQINPINGFTVDIKNMDQAKASLAYGASCLFCVSNIASSRYDAATKAIVTDYGTNVMYFEVVAANFTVGYTPSFQVSGLQTGQTVTSLELYTDAAFTSAPIATSLSGGAYSPAAQVTIDPTVTNTTSGVSLYVKLTIANGIYETLADLPITLAVNGTNASGEKDVVNTSCNTQTDYEDTAIQTLTKRPSVTPMTGTTFVAN